MILTGKAKKDFNKWLNSDEDILQGLDLFQLNNTCIYALIIEWFDSVGIYINPRYNEVSEEFMPQIRFKPIRNNDDPKPFYKTRQEATEKAIEKANEIYNNQNK